MGDEDVTCARKKVPWSGVTKATVGAHSLRLLLTPYDTLSSLLSQRADHISTYGWLVAAYILNKPSPTAEKGWHSSLGVG